jgi:hypothetical protein
VLYALQHTHYDDALDDGKDDKFIGVFATTDDAESSIARLVQVPGFCDAVDGFSVAPFELDAVWGSAERRAAQALADFRRVRPRQHSG